MSVILRIKKCVGSLLVSLFLIFEWDDFVGILYQAYRWIPCEIGCRERESDTVSKSSY